MCHGGPAALDFEDLSLHELQQFINGIDVGVGQLKVLNLNLDSTCQLSCTHTNRTSSPMLPQLAHAVP